MPPLLLLLLLLLLLPPFVRRQGLPPPRRLLRELPLAAVICVCLCIFGVGEGWSVRGVRWQLMYVCVLLCVGVFGSETERDRATNT